MFIPINWYDFFLPVDVRVSRRVDSCLCLSCFSPNGSIAVDFWVDFSEERGWCLSIFKNISDLFIVVVCFRAYVFAGGFFSVGKNLKIEIFSGCFVPRAAADIRARSHKTPRSQRERGDPQSSVVHRHQLGEARRARRDTSLSPECKYNVVCIHLGLRVYVGL